MSNEAHNEAWVNRLDGLEHIPGEAMLDKTAAWDNLHTRMQEKHRRHKARWYWAAACLLVACVAPALLIHKQHYTGINARPAVTHRHADTPATLSLSKKEPAIEMERKINKLVPPAKQDVVLPQPAIIHPVNPNNITTAVKKDTLQITDSMLAAVPVTTAPKKMRVVHINELGEVTTGSAVAYPEYKPFTIRINSPAGLGNQTIANNTIDIYLSPKN